MCGGRLKASQNLGEVVSQLPRFMRHQDLVEAFCLVSARIRRRTPMRVTLQDEAGNIIQTAEWRSLEPTFQVY